MSEPAGAGPTQSSTEWKLPHVLAIIIFSVVTGITGYFGTHLGEAFFKEGKIVETSSPPPTNLAALPGGANELEVQLKTTHDTIKSAFRYKVTVANKANTAATDFPVVLTIPNRITLVGGNPEISSDQPEIRNLAPKKDGNDIEYTIRLLNPLEAISWTFFGYSKDVLEPSPVLVSVHAKDFQQNRVQEAEISGAPTTSFQQLFIKKASEFTGADVLAVIELTGRLMHERPVRLNVVYKTGTWI
jgi:hypothetical protein